MGGGLGKDQTPDRRLAADQAARDKCPRCGLVAPIVYVHGHGRCGNRSSNILDCCQGSDYDLAAAKERA